MITLWNVADLRFSSSVLITINNSQLTVVLCYVIIWKTKSATLLSNTALTSNQDYYHYMELEYTLCQKNILVWCSTVINVVKWSRACVCLNKQFCAVEDTWGTSRRCLNVTCIYYMGYWWMHFIMLCIYYSQYHLHCFWCSGNFSGNLVSVSFIYSALWG